jgi:N-dimethylarginine dimethylaminohydrolase
MASWKPLEEIERVKRLAEETGELIPGMREQGKGIKCFVETDYADLKACLVGNPSVIGCPNGETWEYANMFRYASDEFKAYIKKYGGTNLWETDPATAEKMAKNSDDLAAAYRKAGVHVIRNETGYTPEKLVNYNRSWSEQMQFTLYGQSACEVFGNHFVSYWETSNSNISEITHREAIIEMMLNDPEAIWHTMPVHFPFVDRPQIGPFMAPGDPVIFDKWAIIGIGVADPSHIEDRTKPRSSGDELGFEILRRMLEPHGWKLYPVYFNSKLTYHIDCLLAPLEEGLIAYPKGDNVFWTPLPDELKDWEVIDITMEDHFEGAENNEPLGNKGIVMPAGTKKFAKDLEKRGWECYEVDYSTIWHTFHSGIHCSTAAIWREFDK